LKFPIKEFLIIVTFILVFLVVIYFGRILVYELVDKADKSHLTFISLIFIVYFMVWFIIDHYRKEKDELYFYYRRFLIPILLLICVICFLWSLFS